MKVARRFGSVVFALLLPTPAWPEELTIPGGGPPENTLRMLAEAFNASQSTPRVRVPPSTGRAGALRAIADDETVLARTINLHTDKSLAGKGVHFAPFGLDAVVFAVGASVPIQGLTTSQLLDVFSGRLSDWRELGGESGQIRVVYREPTEASLLAIGEQLEPFRSLTFTANGKLVHRDFQVLELLDRFSFGTSFAARSNLQSTKTPLRAIALDGVVPLPRPRKAAHAS